MPAAVESNAGKRIMSAPFEQPRNIMRFNLAEVPFSRFGSYMAIDQLPAGKGRIAGIYVRTLHGDAPRSEICRIELLRDAYALPGSVRATPGILRIEEHSDRLDICFADEDTLRLRGTGIGLRLSFDFALYDSALPWREGWLINSFSNRMRYALFVGSGAAGRGQLIESESRWIFDCVPDAAGVCEIAFCEAPLRWPRLTEVFARDFGVCLRDVERELAQWLQSAPSVPPEFAAARELAAYVQWSCVVSARGNFRRRAMLMSKHWLNAVWSWDHCFNALALLERHPALAWDQFMLVFDKHLLDYQSRRGALPDCVGDKTVIWNFCKPPVQGWALLWMLRHGAVTQAQLHEIYRPLARWTEWWLAARAEGGGLPQYLHGNDSGWDNASVFDAGLPIRSPDLAAFLILQMDALAEIAQRLTRPRAARRWRERADALLEKMLAEFWQDNRFMARHDDLPCGGDSLLLFLPIVLGQRLPKTIRQELIAALKQRDRFLTAQGLASESTSSPLYESDGYWRGPVWAPAVFLIVEGLRASGEEDFATDIARRFCTVVAKNGMAENFDALTGAGLRDRAHTWTASVFLLLAHSLEKTADE